MGNELDTKFGVSMSLQFFFANPGAGATTDLTLAQGGTGFVVPAGYKFIPTVLCGVSNADLTAGTATFKVTDNGDELTNGPEAVLADTVQRASGVKSPTVGAGIAAGHVVGVSVTTNAGYLPTTADVDAVLVGYLVPA